MKTILKNWIMHWIVFFLTVLFLSVWYATISSIWTSPATLEVTSESKLTVDSWNKLLQNFEFLKENTISKTQDETIGWVKTFSSFPITPSSTPVNNYDVANKKYVDDKNSWIWDVISIRLSSCPTWPCSNTVPLNTRVNLASFNIDWATMLNSNSSAYSHNGKWVITINKSWIYRIEIKNMTLSPSNRYVSTSAPYINWIINSLDWNNVEIYNHNYYAANARGSSKHTFVWQINAWSTISVWYYTDVALTYWWHNFYNGLTITLLQ